MKNKINIINDTNYKISKIELKKFIRNVCQELKLLNIEINYSLTSDENIIIYNKKYFDIEEPTDVIAFPDGITMLDETTKFLGDIIISLQTVEINSKKYNSSFSEELYRVMIHGLLHLIGYDDNNTKNKKIMFDLQEKLLNEMLFSNV
jgi:probable rRNA maturation factor